MPLYQLQAAIFVAVFSLFSAILNFWFITPTTDGQIKLPLPEYVDDNTQPDPFDVIKPDDLVDGYPINERSFYDKVSSSNLSIHMLHY